MKIFICVVVFLALSLFCWAETTMSKAQGEDVIKFATTLLATCSHEASGDIITEARWRQILRVPNIHLSFSPPQKFTFRFTTTGSARVQTISADELLIPISEGRSPDYVLIRLGLM